MRRHTLAFVLALTSAAAAACTGGIEQAADVLSSPTDTPSGSTTPSSTISAPPVEHPIRIRTPRRGDDVLSPVVVSGTAISKSGEIVVDVLDAQGMELAAMNVRIDCGTSCRGEFRARLAFYVTARQQGTIEAFEVGPGGLAEHLVEIGITLVPGV